MLRNERLSSAMDRVKQAVSQPVGRAAAHVVDQMSKVVREPGKGLDRFVGRMVRRIDIKTDIEELTLYRLGKGGRSTHEFVDLNEGQYYPPHRHRESEARLLVVSGSGSIFLNGQEIAYQPGNVFKVPADAWHGFQVGDETVLLSKQTPPIYDAKTGKVDIEYQDPPPPPPASGR